MTERRPQAGRVQPAGTVAALTAVGEQAFGGFPSPTASSGLRGVWRLDSDGLGARLPTPLLLGPRWLCCRSEAQAAAVHLGQKEQRAPRTPPVACEHCHSHGSCRWTCTQQTLLECPLRASHSAGPADPALMGPASVLGRGEGRRGLWSPSALSAPFSWTPGFPGGGGRGQRQPPPYPHTVPCVQTFSESPWEPAVMTQVATSSPQDSTDTQRVHSCVSFSTHTLGPFNSPVVPRIPAPPGALP